MLNTAVDSDGNSAGPEPGEALVAVDFCLLCGFGGGVLDRHQPQVNTLGTSISSSHRSSRSEIRVGRDVPTTLWEAGMLDVDNTIHRGGCHW